MRRQAKAQDLTKTALIRRVAAYATFMVCIDQHQFCDPNKIIDQQRHTCTRLGGYAPVRDDLENLDFNIKQLATAGNIVDQAEYSTIGDAISGRGISALRASELTLNTFQSTLPNNQWIIEASSWFAVSLARIQFGVVEFATGPAVLAANGVVDYPSLEPVQQLCKQQKVRDFGAHQNFSVLGLGLIFGLGLFIIFLSMVAETCLNIIASLTKRRGKTKSHRRLQWILDDKLQLQRMVYQYTGQGEWTNKKNLVPVTLSSNDEKIYRLPENVDPERPGLSQQHDLLPLPEIESKSKPETIASGSPSP
jgi:hypothetical protein